MNGQFDVSCHVPVVLTKIDRDTIVNYTKQLDTTLV